MPLSPSPTKEKATPLGQPLTHTLTSESRRHPPDLAFPYLTQQTTSGATNEYRAETAEGYITADDPDYGLHPIISCSTRVSVATTFARQKTFENKKLVTWVSNDKENPQNWGKGIRWCE
jgi:hypothetical protein